LTVSKVNSGLAADPRSTVVLRGVAGRNVFAVVEELMQACAWETWVPENATVVLKPNLCMSVESKIVGANTHAEVTEAVCRVLQRRTRRIVIGEADHLRQKAWKAFEASGYVELARRVGVDLVNFSEVAWTPVACPPLGSLELPRMLLEADVFITLPVLKTHALTHFTGALKNQWGCVPHYDRILLHKHLDALLPTLHAILSPSLALMDAIVGMEGRGPTNGKPRRMDLLLASRDGVALDATAMRLVGLDPRKARHVMAAGRQGLGRVDSAAIEIDGDWARHATRFEPAVLDGAVAAMNYMSRYPWFVKHVLEKDSVFYRGRSIVRFLRRTHVVAGG
jgi:uncharacterized protein (DUF362 family)